MKHSLRLVGILLLWLGEPAVSAASESQPAQTRQVEIRWIKENGGRVDWSRSGNNLIAFDKLGADGYCDVYTMRPDGSDERCLTCDHPGLPHRTIGQPAWHPSGQWIAFQAEMATHGRANWIATTPGGGTFHDVWMITSDGKRVYQLTRLRSDARDYGVLHPHFSADGKKLSWSEMYRRPNVWKKGEEFGVWKLKIADVVFEAGEPKLINIQAFQPGDEVFYENHGFSPDGTRLLFTSNFKKGVSGWKHNNIYVLELQTGVTTQLTTAGYNEHALFSPDGSTIVWMTNHGNKNGGTDFWLMNADGSGKRRLTHFNQPGFPECVGSKITAADSSWSPDGKHIIGYVQYSIWKQIGKIVLLTLP